MDIIKRKPKTINLKKIKKSFPVKSEIKVSVKEEIKPIEKSFVGGTFPCIDCGKKEAQELGRCRICEAAHQKLIGELDAKPKQIIEKVQPVYATRKEVSGGVVVTISRTEPLRL